MGVSRVTMWLIGVICLATKSPDPPSIGSCEQLLTNIHKANLCLVNGAEDSLAPDFLGFRDQGSGFRVWGSGFGVQGLRVSGLGFRVQGLGFR